MRAAIEANELVVRIPCDSIIAGAQTNHDFRLTDSDEFLNHVAGNFVDFNNNERINELLDDLIEDAVVNEVGVEMIDTDE